MAEGYFRPAAAGDVEHLAPRLRADDAREVAAMNGHGDVLRILHRAVRVSSHCWTGCAPDDEPVALLGVAPLSLLTGIASPWMLGTDRAQEFPRAMVREGRLKVAEMLEVYPHLTNFVDARNERSLRWLRALGFTIHAAAPAGAEGLPFHRFTLDRCR